MASQLTRLRQFLSNKRYHKLADYTVIFLSYHFSDDELLTLFDELRDYLYAEKVLPKHWPHFNQQTTPLKKLGIRIDQLCDLQQQGITTLNQFLKMENQITWSQTDILAVRIRVLILVLLSSLNQAPAPPPPKPATNNHHPSRQPLPEDTIDVPFLDCPWLADPLLYDVTTPQPNSTAYLFDEVYRLPIVTSRRHELWAGAQMKADDRLQELLRQAKDDESPGSIFADLYRQLVNQWQQLASLCEANQLPPPNCVTWAIEIQNVRQDFYKLSQSRFRNFYRHVENSNCALNPQAEIISLAYDCFELLWLLPPHSLSFIKAANPNLRGQLPPVAAFETWLDQQDDLAEAFNFIQQQKITARNRLVTGYLRSVLRFARGYVDQDTGILDYQDLVQEATLGLLTAADRYDYRENNRFITYATSWMWQTTERAIADYNRTIRIPVHRQETFKKLAEQYHPYLERLESPPPAKLCLDLEMLEEGTVDTIREALEQQTELSKAIQEEWHKATQKTQDMLDQIEPQISLETELPSPLVEPLFMTSFDDSVTVQEFIYAPPNDVDNSFLKESLEESLSWLTHRDKQIIQLRFGLTDGLERTLEEVGQVFGVTRERIRQVEKKALNKFAKSRLIKTFYKVQSDSAPHWPAAIINHLNHHHSYWTFSLTEPTTDWQWLDRLIAELPFMNWHDRQDSGVRQQQLEPILQTLGAPAHCTDIAEQFIDTYNEDLADSYIYNLLYSKPESFILLGEGVFSLVAWEAARAKEATPILPFCGEPLPDRHGLNDTFLESLIVAQNHLAHNPTTSDFLASMFDWAKIKVEVPAHQQQAILNAYYLVGLIPYTFHYNGHNPTLVSTMPSLELAEMRHYCLQTLTGRLLAMPEFWGVLQTYQPGNITELANQFVDLHPLGLDDVANRLKLLTNLGVCQRVAYGNRYRLTPFGQHLADAWAVQSPAAELPAEEATEETELWIHEVALW